jgi:hypothetical protein
MKNFKGFAIGLVMGLALAVSSIGLAQTTTQTEPQNKGKEACCAMSSCCSGDSCELKHSASHDPKNHAKDQASKDGCCCCCGSDSCDMSAKPKQ